MSIHAFHFFTVQGAVPRSQREILKRMSRQSNRASMKAHQQNTIESRNISVDSVLRKLVLHTDARIDPVKNSCAYSIKIDMDVPGLRSARG